MIQRSDRLMSLFMRKQRMYSNDPDPEYAAEMVAMARQITDDDIRQLWNECYLCDFRR